MMCKNRIKYLVLILVLCAVTRSYAQDEEKTFIIGLSTQLNFSNLAHISTASRIEMNNYYPITIGLLGQYKNIQSEIKVGPQQLYFDASYTYKKHWFVEANIGSRVANFYEEVHKEYYSSMYNEEIGVYSYGLAIGYRNVFMNRLSFKIAPSIATVSSENQQSHNRTYNYSSIPMQLNKSFHLKPSLVYGGSIRLDLLPSADKNRQFPFVPYFSVNIMGSNSSNYESSRSVDQWVPGNTVYTETINDNNYKYSLRVANVCIGGRIYFGNPHQLNLK